MPLYRVGFSFNEVYLYVEMQGTEDEVDNSAEEYAKFIGGKFIYKEEIEYK